MNSGGLFFLPGEQTVDTRPIAYGVLITTNYRVVFSTVRPDSTWSVPITLLWKVEIVGLIHVRIITKLGTSLICSFTDEIACENGLNYLSSLIDPPKSIDNLFAIGFRSCLETQIPNHPFLLDTSELLQIDDVDESSDTALVCFEFRRMRFNESWKITDVNEAFKICSTYPRFHIVPRAIKDCDIVNMANFRSHNRFSSVVWRSQITGAVLLRCAQPCVGLMYSRNEHDEKFLRAVLSSCQMNPGEHPVQGSSRLLIVDARNYSIAQLNRLRGGGFEYSEYYDQAQICFMDLPNLHIVRVSFERLIQLFSTKSDANWYTMLEKTSWLTYISQLLKAAIEIACALEIHGRSVMVHCTDGWDRTPQLSSLAQLLADPFYRTIKGFRILIEREWLQFGHKFGDRNGQDVLCTNLDERSPIFLQWLDCVHQIYKQFPHCFEFNESFLLKLGLHIYSSLFGTFLFNSEQERRNAALSTRTCSLWGLLSAKYNWTIINYFYEPQTDRLLKPDWQIRSLHLWDTLYETALAPIQNSIIYNAHQPLDPQSSELVPSLSIREPENAAILCSTSETDLQLSTSRKSLTCTTEEKVLSVPSTIVPTSSVKIHGTSDFHCTSSFHKNSRRLSLGDLSSDLDYTTKPVDQFENTSAIMKPIIDALRVTTINELDVKIQRPVMPCLSSLSDDIGIYSSSMLKRVSSPSMNNDDPPFRIYTHAIVPATGAETRPTQTPCTGIRLFPQDALFSVDETTDVFTVDEQLSQNGCSNFNHRHTPPPLTMSILPLDDEDECNSCNKCDALIPNVTNCTASNSNSSPIPILCKEHSITAETNISGIGEVVTFSESPHSDSINTGIQFEENIRWSVTTPGSNASLYVLSEAHRSSPMIEQSKTVSVDSPRTTEIVIANGISNQIDYTVHSLPENEGLLINETNLDDAFSLPLNNELNYSTPVGEAASLNAVRGPSVDYQNKPQNTRSGNFAPDSDCTNKKLKTTTSNTYQFHEGLNIWRDQYFKTRLLASNLTSDPTPFDNKNQSSRLPGKSPKSDTICLTASFNLTDTIYKFTETLQSNINKDDSLINKRDSTNRPVSAPISPTTSLNYFSTLTSNKSTLLTDSLSHQRHDSHVELPCNTNKQCLEIEGITMTHCMGDALSQLPDWDGLPLLVDRLTVHVHTKAYNDKLERQSQARLINTLESNLKFARLEIDRLTESLRQQQQKIAQELSTQKRFAIEHAKVDKNNFTDVSNLYITTNFEESSDTERVGRVSNPHVNMNCNNKLWVTNSRSDSHDSTSEFNSFELIDHGRCVVWQPDSTAPQCTLCCVEFSVLRPRHHCRHCGYVFCGKCSDRRIILPHQTINQPVRVCRRCFTQLSQYSTMPSASRYCYDNRLILSSSMDQVETKICDEDQSFIASAKCTLEPMPSDYPSKSCSTSTSTSSFGPVRTLAKKFFARSNSKSCSVNDSPILFITGNTNDLTPTSSLISSTNSFIRCRNTESQHQSNSSAQSDGIAQA